jgi:hypothetical protein
MKARRMSIWICALIIVACAGNLSAAIVPCPDSSDLQTLITSFTGIANACASQDKLFWNFTYTGLGPNAPTAANVDATLIANLLPGLEIHGWDFSALWAQGTGGMANFTISFLIEVCPSSAVCLGNPIAPGTVIAGADALYAPVSVALPGPMNVSWTNGATATLTSGSPGPLPPLGNIGFNGVGPIGVSATFSGTGAITETTLRFFETVPTSGVPEPVTIFAMGGALIGLSLLGRWRRHA